MAAFGFNENDAKRIGKVVRLVERNPDKRDFGGVNYDTPPPGVRLLVAKHVGSNWPVQSTATVTVYTGGPGSLGPSITVVAYNQYIKFSSDTACSARWVALGHNGWGWTPVDSLSDCGECLSEVGGVDFRIFPGYAATNQQVLGHDASGCIKWFNTTTCATAS